ncbi:MAG: hypothetical protein ABUT20_44275, partial [Bacteroidota bacterium]
MKPRIIYYLVSILSVTAIIYFFFFRWKPDSIYGDDLYIHTTLTGNSLQDQINALLASEKFRPVQIFFMHFQIDLLKDNLNAYYLYNVCFQALNTIVFAQIVNIFLKSRYVSLLFSLTFGLSRFAFFNLEEVLLGGRESVALFSFLMAFYFLLKVIKANEYSNAKKTSNVLLSILFSNIAMYTHERYIVLLVFVLIMILVSFSLRTLSNRKRLLLFSIALASIVINIILKKFVFGVSFLVGTDNTHINISAASSFDFLLQAILSIFQI